VEPCPFCGSKARREHGGRARAGCAGCGSLERHRALIRELHPEFERRGSGRCLELAPRSAEVYGGYVRRHGWEYIGVDRWDLRNATEAGAFGLFIDHDADATDLAFAPSGSCELFITQHVIEQVHDYLAALDETARVLEPGGRALLEIPWEPRRQHTERQPRNRHGSIWNFGNDLLTELQTRFAAVEPVTIREDGYEGSVFVCRRCHAAVSARAADRSSSS
jgi:hypothetical protein